MDDNVLLTPDEVASILRVTPRTLSHWRNKGEGPPYIRASYQIVLYPKVKLQEWLKDRTEEWN